MTQPTPVPTIISFDLSIVRTGYAIDDGDGMTSGSQSFAVKAKVNPALRFRTFTNWLDAMFNLHKPTLVLFELPVARYQGVEALLGIKTRLDEWCACLEIPLHGIYPATLKKAFTGDGDADKTMMQTRAAELWDDYNPVNDPGGDEADARAMIYCWKNRQELQIFEFAPPKKPKKKRVKVVDVEAELRAAYPVAPPRQRARKEKGF